MTITGTMGFVHWKMGLETACYALIFIFRLVKILAIWQDGKKLPHPLIDICLMSFFFTRISTRSKAPPLPTPFQNPLHI